MAGTFTNDEYTDMVLLYGEALENASEARRLYARRFPKRRLPSLSVFKRTVMRLKIDGTFEVQQARQRPANDNVATVQQANEWTQENPIYSHRRAASELGVKRASIKTILKEQSLDPHQTEPPPKRPPIDLEKLVAYCRRIVESDPSIRAKSDFHCTVDKTSERVVMQPDEVESDCRRVKTGEPDNAHCDNMKSDCAKKQYDLKSDSSIKIVDSELENPQFIKVEPLF